MLQREELWNNWKNDGCKEFKRPELPAASTEDVSKPPAKKLRRNLGDSTRDACKQSKFFLGNTELTRLWNLCPDNLQACRGEDRNFLPSIETYLENPKDKVDPSFEWRALRLLARQSPHFFTPIQTPNKVSDYLEGVRKKIHESKTKVKIEVPTEIKTEAIEVVTEKDDGLDVVQDEAELLKTESMGNDDTNTHKTVETTPEQIAELSVVIGSSWKKLGTKLGFSPDEIIFFADSDSAVPKQCRAMLQVWFSDDADANLDNLGYILEGLELIAAADAVKRFIEPVDKMEDISE